MVVNTALMEALATITDDQNLRITSRKSDKGAPPCGACSIVERLVAGPIGMACGATLGDFKKWQMLRGGINNSYINIYIFVPK